MSFIPQEPYDLRVAQGDVPGSIVIGEFGRNPDINIASAPADVWENGGVFTGFPTGPAEELEVFSSDAADTAAGTGAQTVRITQLHDDTGAEQPDITVNLNGTTPVDVNPGVNYYRANRVVVVAAGTTGSNEGTITLRHKTTTANIFGVMSIGTNRTTGGTYSVPLGHTLNISRVHMAMARASGAVGSCNAAMRARPYGMVFVSVLVPEITDGSDYQLDGQYISLPERTDLKFTAVSVSDNATIVTAEFGGFLVKD